MAMCNSYIIYIEFPEKNKKNRKRISCENLHEIAYDIVVDDISKSFFGVYDTPFEYKHPAKDQLMAWVGDMESQDSEGWSLGIQATLEPLVDGPMTQIWPAMTSRLVISRMTTGKRLHNYLDNHTI